VLLLDLEDCPLVESMREVSVGDSMMQTGWLRIKCEGEEE